MGRKGFISALCLLCLLVSSCREEVMPFSDVSSVSFSASSGFFLPTKTEYAGGYVSDGNYERLNWLSGDGLTVLSPQAVLYDRSADPWTAYYTSTDPRYSVAHYTVSGEITPEGIYSTAGVAPFDDNDLHWGEGSHLFFGVYPRLCTLPSSVQSHVGIETDATRTKGVINAYIPRDQVARSSNPSKSAGKSVRNSSVDSVYIYPQMEYAWMYSAQYAPKAEEEVKLLFSPMVTTFQIAVTGTGEEDVELTRFEMVSESDALQGSFTATVCVEGNNTVITRENVRTKMLCELDVDAPSAGDNMKVTFTFPSGTKVSGSKKVTLTVFAFPKGAYNTSTLSNLTISFVSPGVTRSLRLMDAGKNNWVQFPAGKKNNIDGLTLPRQEDPWTFTVTGEDWEEELSDVVITPVQVTEYENQEGGNLDERAYVLDVDWESLTLDEAGGAKADFATVKSYKDNAAKTPVPYQLEYYDGSQWKVWDSNAPAWLTMSAPASGYAGSYSGDALNLTMAPQVNSATDAHHNAMIAKGSYSTAFDLSTRNVATGETVSRTTANCYVADRPGKYRLPLVYGNGLKDGSPNPAAYSQSQTTSVGFLTSYKDHLDNDITSPYIATQHSGKQLSAAIIWADSPGLVTDASISGSGSSAYLNFTVPAENITQGNALVAVLVGGEVAWSWHIWVTDQDLSVSDNKAAYTGSNNKVFAPVNLGWSDSITRTYSARTCSLRVVQPASAKESSHVRIEQSYASYTEYGRNPFYQWGRKDPLTAGKAFGDQSYSPNLAAGGPVSLGAAIQHPWNNYITGATTIDWCSDTWYNLWNSNLTFYGSGQYATKVIKSVYDPSPVGYMVPPQDAYSGFSASNCTVENASAGNSSAAVVYNSSSLRFPLAGYLAATDGSCIYPGQVSHHWSAVPSNSIQAYPLTTRYSGGIVSTTGPLGRSYAVSVRPVLDEVPASYTYYLTAMPPAKLEAGGGTSSNGFVTSYRTNDNTGDTEGVAWSVAGYYSDATCTTPYNGSNASTRPAWLTSITGGGSGSAPGASEALSATVSASPYSTVTQDAETTISNIIGGNGIRGSESRRWNLANPSSPYSNSVAESANCYIVNACGYYRIPLVMGNGMVNNAINTNASTYKGATGTYSILFQDYTGSNITNPKLHRSSSGAGSPSSAFVVWEDVNGLIEAGSNYTLPNALEYDSSADLWWLNFHVDKARQGNAVIAVADASGTVMWSWHIWVTHDDQTNVTIMSDYDFANYNLMLMNLGWLPSGSGTVRIYSPRTVYVKIQQADGGQEAVMALTQAGKTVYTSFPTGGRGPYWQWGRKDAMWPSGTCYGRFGSVSTLTSRQTLADVIKNPGKFIATGESSCWSSYSQPGNLWDSATKTIWDPCPAGYTVPSQAAITLVFNQWPDNVAVGTFNRGWHFYNSARTETVFFPAAGLRTATSGAVAEAGSTGNYWNDLMRTGDSGGSLWYFYDQWAFTAALSRSYGLSIRPKKR